MSYTTNKKSFGSEVISLNIDIAGLVQDASRVLALIGGSAKQAMRRSLRRTMVGVRQQAVQAIRDRYVVKAGVVRKSMRVSVGDTQAELRSTGRVLPLKDFSPRPSTPSPRRKKPVTVEVRKGQRKAVKGGFVARMQSGHLGVMRRQGASRLPIEELYTLSVPQMLTSGEGDSPAVEEIKEYGATRLMREVEHEISRLLGGRK